MNTMTLSNLVVHLVAVPLAAWGHTRPLISLLINLSRIHPCLRITILTTPAFAPRVLSELDRGEWTSLSQEGGNDPHNVIRVKTVVNGETSDGVWEPPSMARQAVEFGELLGAVLEELLTEGIWGPPTVCVYDTFQTGFVRAIDGVLSRLGGAIKRPRLLTFFPSNASWCYNCWCTLEEGSDLARALQITDKLKAEKGMCEGEAMQVAMTSFHGYVLRTPGLGEMYDYEQYPQYAALPTPKELLILRRDVYAQKDLCDGFLLPCDPELETEAAQALQRTTGKDVFAMGPQFPNSVWKGRKPMPKEKDQEVIAFLDKMQTEGGKHSVIYISFGSLFWPALRPDLIIHLVSTLIASNYPFIFAYASWLARVPDEVVELVKGYGDRGKLISFAPQEVILAHEAVGFFLSHMGSNSVHEAILAGVPLVAWPFMGDQPEFTQQMVTQHGIALELIQVRTTGVGKRTRSGILIENTPEAITREMEEMWRRIRGPEGAQCRDRVGPLRERLRRSWKDGGAKMNMLRIQEIWK